jgi:hypothetical protein
LTALHEHAWEELLEELDDDELEELELLEA